MSQGENVSGRDESPFVKGYKHKASSSHLPPGLARLSSSKSAMKLLGRSLSGFQSYFGFQIASNCSCDGDLE